MASDCAPSTNPSITSNAATKLPMETKQTGGLSRAWHTVCAAARVTCAVSEGAAESLVNLCHNLADMLPPAVRGQRKEPYTQDLTGKVAIVTGGNAGIGFATATQLARRGAHVVIACRDKARAESAVQAIRQTDPLAILPTAGSITPPADPTSSASAAVSASASVSSPPFPPASPSPALPLSVEAMHLDLGRLSSVRQFAEEWGRRGLPLHLLVCNAGVMAPLTKTLTPDGLEVQFQVNFLSHWLLTHLLLERERSRRREAAASKAAAGKGGPCSPSDSTRVVVVSSVVHRAGPLQWHDPLSERSYEPYITYGMSKLATVVFAKELQRRMDRHPEYGLYDSAVALHPGIVRTHLANNFFRTYALSSLVGTWMEPLHLAWRRFVDSSFQMLLATPQVAADRMLAACLGPREQLAGRYMALGRVYSADKTSDDPAYAEQLWSTATLLTGHTPGPSLA